MRIAQNEATAAKRSVAFFCTATDGITPLTGLTFAAAELQVGKGFTFANCTAANVHETGDGWYWYEFTVGNVDTLGSLAIKTNKSGVYSVLREHQVV